MRIPPVRFGAASTVTCLPLRVSVSQPMVLVKSLPSAHGSPSAALNP